MRKVLLAPSILSADFKKLKEEISEIESYGAEYLHFDVMDGHFVDNISFGLPVLKSIAFTHNMVNDVHIMISDPLHYAQRFYDSGADILTFHYEACQNEEDIFRMIDIARRNNKKIGISIKPKTNVDVLFPYIDKVDLILIMSVEPGFGGQSFLPNSIDKIKTLRSLIDDKKLSTLIEVDGGINENTAKMVKEAGADILVAGSYVFNGDKKQRLNSLR